MQKIFIEGLKIYGYHGCLDGEKALGQFFLVSVEMMLAEPALGDDIDTTINYAQVSAQIEAIVKNRRFDLIESLAEEIAKTMLHTYQRLGSVAVVVEKPSAPIPVAFERIGVMVERSRHTAFLGLGSNLNDRNKNIDDAIMLIDESSECKVVNKSRIINTKPWGLKEQDDFLNCVIEVKTLLEPAELLQTLKSIEAKMGREKTVKWGPRNIDIDILLYDTCIYSSPDLQIPHPYMHERKFVLEPLAEIAPYVLHPLENKRVKFLNDACGE
jgi:dihydroneopterin aldolase/2-amino-4-hydroxy-6-hydroxymethyldihydropteridine diphosphokinase